MVFRHVLDTAVTRKKPNIAEKRILVFAVALRFMSVVGFTYSGITWHLLCFCTLTPIYFLKFTINTSLRSYSLYSSPSVRRCRNLRPVH